MEAISYFLIVANTRAFTQASYGWTAVTDFLFAGQNFVMMRLIAKSPVDDWWSGLGYALGGVSGSLLSIWVTLHLYGK